MRVFAADGPAIGLDLKRRETASPEDVPIGLDHFSIADIQPLGVGVEAVEVFHVEFADAQQATARPWLVSKLGLDLVKPLREVAVRDHILLDQKGDDLLMSWSQDETPAPAVLQPKECVPEGLSPSRCLPYLRGLQDRHSQLLTSRAVDLVANHGFDLIHGPPAQGKHAIDPRRQRCDQPSPDQEPMAYGLRVGGIFPESFPKQF